MGDSEYCFSSDEECPSVLEDVAFIRDKYKGMFHSLAITEASEDETQFTLTTVNSKVVRVSLSTSSAYTVLEGEGKDEQFESFEQLLVRLMGPAAFSHLISRLVTSKLAESSFFVSLLNA